MFSDTATTTYTVTVAGGRTSSLKVATHQDARLPADRRSVIDALIDSAPAPTGSVTLSGSDLTFDLGARDPGVYTVTFAVTLASMLPATYRSSATALYTAADAPAATALSAAVLVVVGADDAPAVDLAINLGNAGSSLEPIPIGAGSPGDTLAYITNAGTTATTVSLLVEVGAGLRSGDILDIGEGQNGVTRMSCPGVSGHPQQRRCQLPELASGGEIVIDVEVGIAPSHVAGSTAALTLTVEPTAPGSVEADPSDNSAVSIYQFAGVANLTTDMTATAPSTTVGSTLGVTVTVMNTGPDPAPQAAAEVRLNDDSGTFELIDLSASAGQPQRLSVGTSITWPIGDLAVGQSATAKLILRALAPGAVTLEIMAHSVATDPACSTPADCPVLNLPLTSLAVVTTPATGGPGTPVTETRTPPTTGDDLADTGSPIFGLSVLAAALLIIGAGLLRIVRRRPHEADPIQ
ncbi:MAG: hypothetical protein JWM76_3062 [Pseudonocardiales bacterium]|nr:hypothetical protein [Pseudonocardiales bacterium]